MKDYQTDSKLKKQRVIVLSLALIPFSMVLGNSMLIPELPTLAQALGVSQVKISLLISFFSLSGGISIPILGYLSDKYNRKTILLYSLLLYGSGGIIVGLLALFTPQNYAAILTARILQGLGAGGTYPLAIALVGDIFQIHRRKKVLGLLEAANAGGKVLSPFLGALVALFFWPGLFFVYPLFTFPLAFTIYYLIPTQSSKTKKIKFSTYLTQITSLLYQNSSKFLVYLTTSTVVLFISFGLLSYLSELLPTTYQIYGLKKAALLAVPIITMVITAFWMGTYLKKNNPPPNYLLSGGLLINALSLLILPFLDGLVLYLVLIACLGIGNGIVLTVLNTIFTNSSPNYRGGLTSIYSSMRFIGIALGPPSFALLNQINSFTMFIIPALMALLLSLCNLFI